jgi:hypothetical protein
VLKSSTTLDKLSFGLFALAMGMFYLIPDPIQVPFRGILLFAYLAVYVITQFNQNFKLAHFWIIGALLVVFGLSLTAGAMHGSFFLVSLSLFPVLMIKDLAFDVTPKRELVLRVLAYLGALGIIVQMCFFRYDGRPRMGYEINLTGAFLFMFLLYCDACRIWWGKWLVLFLSFLLLSRLLIFSIIGFYLIRWGKRWVFSRKKKPNVYLLMIVATIVTWIFSAWYVLHMADSVVNGESDASRLSTLNDGSNFLRFEINTFIVGALLTNSDPHLVNGGYGIVAQNPEYVDKYVLMPHNELLKSVAEFGLIATILFWLVSVNRLSKFIRYDNVEYFLVMIFYTQILWVRILVVPGPEMVFFMLIVSIKNKLTPNENLLPGN